MSDAKDDCENSAGKRIDWKLDMILSGLDSLADHQVELERAVVHNKNKIDDISSMFHNKCLQLRSCSRDVKEVKSICSSLKRDMSDLKTNLFYCNQYFSKKSVTFNPNIVEILPVIEV